jgi:hypothetical protein
MVRIHVQVSTSTTPTVVYWHFHNALEGAVGWLKSLARVEKSLLHRFECAIEIAKVAILAVEAVDAVDAVDAVSCANTFVQ